MALIDVDLTALDAAIGKTILLASVMGSGLRVQLADLSAVDFFDVPGARGDATVQANRALAGLTGRVYQGTEYTIATGRRARILTLTCADRFAVVVTCEASSGPNPMGALSGQARI